MKKGTFVGRMAILILGVCLGIGFGPSDIRAQEEIKELIIGIGVDADTLNPQEQTTSLIMNMAELIHDTLFFQTPDAKLEPRLATEYKASEDGLTYTVKLRPGVKFSDGTPLTAKIMKETIDRALDPAKRVPLRYYLSMIESASVVDDLTFQVKLKYPFAPFPYNLAQVMLSPTSPQALEKYGEDVRQHPVGAGPYVLKEWVKGDRIVMVRNDNYWGKKPTVAQLTWKIVPETATREAMLRAGQLHICYKPSPANVAALKADPAIKVEMPLDTRTIFMGMNCQKGPTANKLVRQAFNYAVDKKAIVSKILFDTAVPMEGPVSPIMWGYHKMEKQYEYNPEKAKELLKKANFDFNRTIQMRTPQGRYLFDKQIAEYVQASLQALGVKVELRTYDWPTYVAGLQKPLEETELEIFLLGWGPFVMDADYGLYGQFHTSVNPPKGLGSAFYSNPEFDKIMDESRRELNPEKRKELLKKASEIVWDDCPWIWLHVEKFLLAYNSKIEGLIITPYETFYPTYVTMKK
jgi:ABC-type transport system substrate-binding protein